MRLEEEAELLEIAGLHLLGGDLPLLPPQITRGALTRAGSNATTASRVIRLTLAETPQGPGPGRR